MSNASIDQRGEADEEPGLPKPSLLDSGLQLYPAPQPCLVSHHRVYLPYRLPLPCCAPCLSPSVSASLQTLLLSSDHRRLPVSRLGCPLCPIPCLCLGILLQGRPRAPTVLPCSSSPCYPLQNQTQYDGHEALPQDTAENHWVWISVRLHRRPTLSLSFLMCKIKKMG